MHPFGQANFARFASSILPLVFVMGACCAPRATRSGRGP